LALAPDAAQVTAAVRHNATALQRSSNAAIASTPIFRFPWRALSQYHPFAYTVICTSSSAVIARNEDGGPNPEEFDGSSTIRRSDGSDCCACARDACLCRYRDPVVARDDRPQQRRRGQARQRFQRLAKRLQDRAGVQGQLRRYAERR